MGRFASNKEYAIRITHPEIGGFYFSYDNWGKYIFTSDLSKVRKWKTLDVVKKQIDRLINNTNYYNDGRSRIRISDFDVPNHLLSNVIHERKQKYYLVKKLVSKSNIRNIEKNMDDIYNVLKPDFKNISDLFQKDKFKEIQYEEDFLKYFNGFLKLLNEYKKNQRILSKQLNNKYETIYIDIVDASFNFRGLKLKKLEGKQTEIE